MNQRDIEFLKRLQETFKAEADEHLRAISAGLIELEKVKDAAKKSEIAESIFREVHSLKGAARSVEFKDIETICQSLESAFAAYLHQEIQLSKPLFNLFHQTVNILSPLVLEPNRTQTSSHKTRYRETIRQLSGAAKGEIILEEQDAPVLEIQEVNEPPDPASKIIPPQDSVSLPAESVRIPINKIDPLLHKAEEMIQAKVAGNQRMVDLNTIQQSLTSLNKELSSWIDYDQSKPVEIPNWIKTHFETLINDFANVTQSFENDQRSLQYMVDTHLNSVKSVLMLPVSTLVEFLPKLVRDLANDQGKEIELIIQGQEIEVDKRILEELKDPLIHIIRNCVDHGIETPTKRIQQNKAPKGTITLKCSASDSREFEIQIKDDGAGIESNQIRATAIKAGILTEKIAETLNEQEALALIFQSGISTSEIITNISGRGLGLAIVHEKVEKLGGSITVETQAGLGTTFRMLLPLSLVTFRGVVVRDNERLFVLPTSNVEAAIKVKKEEVQTVENHETIEVDGQILGFARLGEVFNLPAANNGRDSLSQVDHSPAGPINTSGDYLLVLIITSAQKRIVLQVDEVVTEEEVLVKRLGKQLKHVRNIAGATILGAGNVVPVLNVSELIDSAVQMERKTRLTTVDEQVLDRTGRILVAEDSITARTLLKNILESNGYQVTTAVDGVDAFTHLRTGHFDLVVSDVDMPRMSGFELTTKIRNDEKYNEIPVVLVTALESRSDRERGIEVGANAYIIKSSFDQSNLLEVIQQLL